MVKGEAALLTAENAQNAERRFRSVFVIFVVKQFSRLPVSGLRIGSNDGGILRSRLES
jgi:hypothetical protein